MGERGAEQGPQERARAEKRTGAAAPTPNALPVGVQTPKGYADLVRANPSARDAIFEQLHQTAGNGFVQQVVAELQSARAVPSSGKGGGSQLPGEARTRMERSFGADLSAVRIHEDGNAEAAGAEAYAQGTDIHFARGRFDPHSTGGLELLGHEVAHVMQQAEGRVGETVQHKRVGAMNDDSSLEHEADVAGAHAARGERAQLDSSTSLASAAPIVQRRATVTPVPAVRKPKADVLGDGTPAHPGMTIDALEAYTTAQADWFTDPSFTAADREAVWKVVNLFHFGGHVSPALAKLHTGEVAALPSREVLFAYVNGFDAASDSIQLTTPAPTLARALQLGTAMKELSTFVPGAVLRHVIPESGLEFMITHGKVAELKSYYTTFKPTLEKPEEWPHIQTLLVETIAANMPLLGWVSELHIFTQATRAKLIKNVANTSRSKPVMLVVMSALDWNTAFLQGAELELAIDDAHNLGLIVQGRTLAAVTAQVARVAKDYGQGGKLGQVVLAGHGSDTSMEMASDAQNADWDANNNRVHYDGQGDIDSKHDPKKNGTEALIDTILNSLDPATASIVFAGCLINSHDIDPTKSNLKGKAADIEKQLRANIKAHPNLADYVKSRMVATKHNAAISAANASTGFATFNVDHATGKAQLSDVNDPHIGGAKIGYLRDGIEPEGVMRAAIECCADPGLGVVKTTAEINTRVAALKAPLDQAQTCIRVAFGLALPGGAGNVDVSKLADVMHRIGTWNELDAATPAQRLADSVLKSEAKTVFDGLLAVGMGDAVDADIHQAWIKHDPSHAAQMMTKLETSGLTVETFQLQLSRGLVDPHLMTMLPIGGTPTRAQMLLALTIADSDAALPSHVRDFLRAAAGGSAARSFPAPLDVKTLLPNGAENVLERIGLTDKTPPTTGTVPGNVDTDGDGKNDTRIATEPHKAIVDTDNLMVRDKPSSAAKDIGKLAKKTIIRVAGTTREGTWSMIDFNGKAGFVATKYLKS